jgi:hypothetical protein
MDKAEAFLTFGSVSKIYQEFIVSVHFIFVSIPDGIFIIASESCGPNCGTYFVRGGDLHRLPCGAGQYLDYTSTSTIASLPVDSRVTTSSGLGHGDGRAG